MELRFGWLVEPDIDARARSATLDARVGGALRIEPP
jgi:hypothetical protein